MCVHGDQEASPSERPDSYQTILYKGKRQGADVQQIHFFLSLFPLLLAIFALTGIFGGDRAFELIAERLRAALPGQAAAYLLAYPAVVWLARRMGAWDALHDAAMALAGLLLASAALWLNWSSILTIVEI